MNRGSLSDQGMEGAARGASMRPRFMNRGSEGAQAAQEAAVRSFNEAPIHESGKWQAAEARRAAPHAASMRPRFMNRGSMDARREGMGRSGASMRPRFMNRGSGQFLPSGYHPRCGFNEAPIHESGKSRERGSERLDK